MEVRYSASRSNLFISRLVHWRQKGLVHHFEGSFLDPCPRSRSACSPCATADRDSFAPSTDGWCGEAVRSRENEPMMLEYAKDTTQWLDIYQNDASSLEPVREGTYFCAATPDS